MNVARSRLAERQQNSHLRRSNIADVSPLAMLISLFIAFGVCGIALPDRLFTGILKYIIHKRDSPRNFGDPIIHEDLVCNSHTRSLILYYCWLNHVLIAFDGSGCVPYLHRSSSSAANILSQCCSSPRAMNGTHSYGRRSAAYACVFNTELFCHTPSYTAFHCITLPPFTCHARLNNL